MLDRIGKCQQSSFVAHYWKSSAGQYWYAKTLRQMAQRSRTLRLDARLQPWCSSRATFGDTEFMARRWLSMTEYTQPANVPLVRFEMRLKAPSLPQFLRTHSGAAGRCFQACYRKRNH